MARRWWHATWQMRAWWVSAVQHSAACSTVPRLWFLRPAELPVIAVAAFVHCILSFPALQCCCVWFCGHCPQGMNTNSPRLSCNTIAWCTRHRVDRCPAVCSIKLIGCLVSYACTLPSPTLGNARHRLCWCTLKHTLHCLLRLPHRCALSFTPQPKSASQRSTASSSSSCSSACTSSPCRRRHQPT